MLFDVCIIGHLTQDRIEISGQAPALLPGGTAYYASVAARRLGLATAVVTKLHESDRAALLADLTALQVEVRCLPSAATTKFVNIYPSQNPDRRIQRVAAVADPFRPEELDVAARVYLIGALTKEEVSPACVEALAATGSLVALDIQGLVRTVRDERVALAQNDRLFAFLEHVDVLKASREEALFVTGAATVEAAAQELAEAGPREVIVTSGSRGSLVLTDRGLYPIPAYPPVEVVDTTGCGDTYLAAYLARRLAGVGPEASGHFAAAICTAKIGNHGAFRGTAADGLVHERHLMRGAGL